MYYTSWEASVELQWRLVDFATRCAREQPVLRLRVALADAPSQTALADAAQAPLSVWQSGDRALVAVFAADAASRVHVALSPSPSRAAHASAVGSTHFAFSAQRPQQQPWQLLQLFPREAPDVHHLVLNKGAVVLVLVFAIAETRCAGDAEGVTTTSGRRLGVHRFGQSACDAAG